MANPLDFVISQFINEAKKVASRALPRCSCGRKAIPIPCPCGNFSCIEHGFFSKTMKTICAECAESIGILYEDEEEDDLDWIWDTLGIQPTSDAAFIESAFKQKAKTCHPDRGGSQKKFVRLQEAKKEALKYARGT